jgi:hypothetical protein
LFSGITADIRRRANGLRVAAGENHKITEPILPEQAVSPGVFGQLLDVGLLVVRAI